jgi:hypothetical protein
MSHRELREAAPLVCQSPNYKPDNPKKRIFGRAIASREMIS